MKLFIDNFPNDLNKALAKRAIDEGISKAELIIRVLKAYMQTVKRED